MFTLDPQLARDTLPVGDLPLCRLLLMNDTTYPWFILVPRRADIREIYQLDLVDQQQLLTESSRLARLLVERFAADKLNIATLGNLVPQLHLHHLVRYRTDPAWPKPVWGLLPPRPYSGEAAADLCRQVAAQLPDLAPCSSP
ncbi:MAG: HIT domain-containing protein [Desulfuromonadales bacterium]|nr:HIT domain-containing protein [Desulfuromonadales bacterium]